MYISIYLGAKFVPTDPALLEQVNKSLISNTHHVNANNITNHDILIVLLLLLLLLLLLIILYRWPAASWPSATRRRRRAYVCL